MYHNNHYHSRTLPYLHLLDDEVEVVPAGVGKQPGVEGEGDDGWVCLRPVPGEVLGVPRPQLDEPGEADEDEGEDLGVGEVVLHAARQADARAVDEANQAQTGGRQQAALNRDIEL